ncbi:hypothetical protein ACWCQL_38075 [Streptomyces sp. NPDC002073]
MTISPEQRAESLLFAVCDAAGDGCHVLAVSAGAHAAVVPFHNTGGTTYLGKGVKVADVVAAVAAVVTEESYGAVLRTNEEDGRSRIQGWSVTGSTAIPGTAEEMRDAYSVDAATGEPISPAPGQYYAEAPHLHLV